MLLAGWERARRQHEATILVDQIDTDVVVREETLARLGNRVEYGFGVLDRTADHAQNFGRSLLLLERLFGFSEQPRVLDRDDGLVGKALEHCDLSLGEHGRFGAGEAYGSNWFAVAKHWHYHSA